MNLAFPPWQKLLLQPQERDTSFLPRCQSQASIYLFILGEKTPPFHLCHPKLRLFLCTPNSEKPQGLHRHHVKSTGAPIPSTNAGEAAGWISVAFAEFWRGQQGQGLCGTGTSGKQCGGIYGLFLQGSNQSYQLPTTMRPIV